MRFIYGIDGDYDTGLFAFDRRDAKVLTPVFTRALLEAERHIAHFEGIKECGNFGTKQSNALEMWEERRQVISDFLELTGYKKE